MDYLAKNFHLINLGIEVELHKNLQARGFEPFYIILPAILV